MAEKHTKTLLQKTMFPFLDHMTQSLSGVPKTISVTGFIRCRIVWIKLSRPLRRYPGKSVKL